MNTYLFINSIYVYLTLKCHKEVLNTSSKEFRTLHAQFNQMIDALFAKKKIQILL